MAQNIYDDEAFFDAYAQLPRSVEGLAGAAEWPAMRALLPRSLRGARVLDLGCGYGWFCRWAAEAGASRVVGIDVSERMLAQARATTDDPRIEYRQGDLDALQLEPDDEFDLVYSSLTLHYLTDLELLLDTVHSVSMMGTRFVCSVEHPIYTAPTHPAFAAGPGGAPVWPVDGYLREGARVTDWLAPGVVKQHRTIETYLRELRSAGFQLVDLREWGPTDAQVRAHPEWEQERDRPPFLLISSVAIRRD